MHSTIHTLMSHGRQPSNTSKVLFTPLQRRSAVYIYSTNNITTIHRVSELMSARLTADGTASSAVLRCAICDALTASAKLAVPLTCDSDTVSALKAAASGSC
jgi:hypothetical protein